MPREKIKLIIRVPKKIDKNINMSCSMQKATSTTHSIDEIYDDRELLMCQLQILYHALPLPWC